MRAAAASFNSIQFNCFGSDLDFAPAPPSAGRLSPTTAAAEAMPARVAAEIAALPEPRGPMRRLCGDLARRIRLLAPLLQQLQGALPLADALGAARDLLRAVHDGSKIYQVLLPCSSRLSPLYRQTKLCYAML